MKTPGLGVFWHWHGVCIVFGVMKKMKNKLNDEMGYFKGMPKGTYCEVLDEMMHTKVN